MAFTFLVETGTGLVAGANSYVSVADADDAITLNIHADDAWNAKSISDKERLLALATRILDNYARWFGTKTVTTPIASPLRWPRTGVSDRDSVLIDANTIPEQLKVATAEVARFYAKEDRTLDRDQDGLESITADVVELVFRKGYRLPVIPATLTFLIQGLGTITSGKPRFVNIIR